VWIETANFDDKYEIWPYRTTFNGILIDWHCDFLLYVR
jgi:hypothetical protein